MFLFDFSSLEAWAQESAVPRQELCRRVTLQGQLEPGLTDTEKKLVCGGDGAWRVLPISQVRYNVRNFLQDRGYFHPQFVEELPQGGHLTVEVGLPTRVTGLDAPGAPEGLRLRRLRKVVGQILTPELLGRVERWVQERLGAIGYPCPQITARGDPDTGTVIVEVNTGPLQDLVSVFEEPIPGVPQGFIRRYDAFRLGDRFDRDLLTVTANRVLSLNLLQATYFTESCGNDGASAHQEVTAGPPRLLTFGIGVDTEGLIQLRATWRNARIGNRASFAQASAQFSTKTQEVNALLNWYYLPFPSRRYLQPSFKLQHQNQNAYQVVLTRAGLAMATTYDRGPVGLELFAGPVLEFVRTLAGSGSLNPNSYFLQLETTLRLRSHEFEYWATDPRQGYTLAMSADFAAQGLAATASAQRLRLGGEALWNFRDYDPPLWVLGLRGAIATTLSPERPGLSSLLPANYFWYLGGSTDLRGFSLQSVPAFGAMTAFYLDPELRLTDLPLWGVQPFFFWDVGAVGASPLAFDSPLLDSPGVGLRYRSPFGVFRTTLARGFPVEPYGGWTFFFSFGEEF